MTEQEQLITSFYYAFQRGDYAFMQRCYSDNVVFTDEVFRELNAAEVRAMWEMLIKRGRDLHITFGMARADGNEVTIQWQATYTFSKTKRKVINRVQATFVLENGKIMKHRDHFSFYRWGQQAFGLTGLLLGWTGYFRNKVRRSARRSLASFLKSMSE